MEPSGGGRVTGVSSAASVGRAEPPVHVRARRGAHAGAARGAQGREERRPARRHGRAASSRPSGGRSTSRLKQLRATDERILTQPREVGRGKLPSTVLGLMVHAAEHTQRHVGQLLVTVRVLRGSKSAISKSAIGVQFAPAFFEFLPLEQQRVAGLTSGARPLRNDRRHHQPVEIGTQRHAAVGRQARPAPNPLRRPPSAPSRSPCDRAAAASQYAAVGAAGPPGDFLAHAGADPLVGRLPPLLPPQPRIAIDGYRPPVQDALPRVPHRGRSPVSRPARTPPRLRRRTDRSTAPRPDRR